MGIHALSMRKKRGIAMADVKWIKITTDIFDNRKMRQIESMPEGDTLMVIWLKLLILAGDVNEGGYIYFTKDIPYTDQLLATQFRRPLTTIQLALHTFEKFEMIEIFDDVIRVSNWEKYQNIEGMERIREQTRKRVAKYREKKKDQCNATVTLRNAIEEDIDKEEDKEIDYIESNDSILMPPPADMTPYQKIVDMYHSICISYPKLRGLSETRKKAIKARLKTYSLSDLEEAFRKAEASSFMKGNNNRNWSADFDWIIVKSGGGTLAKILEGKYDDAPKVSSTGYDPEIWERLANERREDFD